MALTNFAALTEELLTAWQAGDRRAGSELIDRFLEPVRRFLPRVDECRRLGTAM